jgi:hypothetical protein
MPIQLIIRNPLDRDAREFIQRAGVTDAAARLQLNEFVRGIKGLGLWDSMVAWPLRSTQNAGTGTTAYSLGGLGTFNGTLVNGPTWAANGIAYSGAAFSQRISAPLSLVNEMLAGGSIFAVVEKSNEDNFVAFIADNAATGNPTATSLLFNIENATGVLPVISRGSPASRYFHGNAGGAWAAGFSSGAGVIRSTSQANFRNGSLIANITGLGSINTAGTIDACFVGRRGNGSQPLTAHSITLVTPQQLSNSQVTELHNLYKTTLGTGLGLP